jgi:hypothetical protein
MTRVDRGMADFGGRRYVGGMGQSWAPAFPPRPSAAVTHLRRGCVWCAGEEKDWVL